MLMAIAGTPSLSAVTAAPTVPECTVAAAMFCPALVPEITRSGGAPAYTTDSPNSVASAGDPATTYLPASGWVTVGPRRRR